VRIRGFFFSEAKRGPRAKEFGKHWFRELHTGGNVVKICICGNSLLNTGKFPSASLSLHTRGTTTADHSQPDAVQISVAIFMWCHAAPEGQWVDRKPLVVNKPRFVRPADLSKRRELFIIYTQQTARRLEYFAPSDSDL